MSSSSQINEAGPLVMLRVELRTYLIAFALRQSIRRVIENPGNLSPEKGNEETKRDGTKFRPLFFSILFSFNPLFVFSAYILSMCAR
jgi:hypothetical protein